ncbi:UDP-N-acetylmuramoyl-L-alanyl-D-glutamate--2,6-diaminopimelate ligase, partial [Candidatus Microgenomates bacterium]|nr:UDP-N-acetylmuramoyl-L-alanyl-D-glutamate--2,6-diaminopimelate ligase [Candidatus Microgenomates bacterium]
KTQISNLHLKSQNFITYGLKNNSDVNPKSFPFKTKLMGEFNKYNILAAAAAARTLGIKDQVIKKAIASFQLPVGRMEVVYNGAFMVIIDFAHTPNALEQVLSTVKKNTKGRLIHVFGSAGERDFQKRPEMGRVSGKYADIIILTAEDPRSESVDKIIEEIESGIKKSGVLRVQNRQEAINTAIKMAKKGDVVLLTGKGHEQSMNYGRGEEPWSEHEAVKQALKKS